MHRYSTSFLLAPFFFAVASIASAQTPLPDPIPGPLAPGPEIKLFEVASGFVAPNWGTAPRGDGDRLFVVDQVGLLWVVDLDDGSKEVFLDLSDRLVTLGGNAPPPFDLFDERGFLGLAFHPQYAKNGLFYTYTSESPTAEADFRVPFPPDVSANHHSVVSEWHVPDPKEDASRPDPKHRRVLMRVEQPQFNHNSGALVFDKEGLLLIAIGDGGAADDQGPGHSAEGNGQDRSNVLGTILRIDPTGRRAPNGQYSVPRSNPFASKRARGGQRGCRDGICDEIFAYGFRNAFRISVDRRTGDVYAADVGQNDIEEIDVVLPGRNYGWNIREGSFCFEPAGPTEDGFVVDGRCGPRSLVDPVAEYDHDEGLAVVGGFVYRGNDVRALRGHYVFGDFSPSFLAPGGRLFTLERKGIVQRRGRNGDRDDDDDERHGRGHGTDRHDDRVKLRTSDVLELVIEGQTNLGLFLLGFAEDADGELYVLGNQTSVPVGETGVLLRIDD